MTLRQIFLSILGMLVLTVPSAQAHHGPHHEPVLPQVPNNVQAGAVSRALQYNHHIKMDQSYLTRPTHQSDMENMEAVIIDDAVVIQDVKATVEGKVVPKASD